jgi:hypothetical protein
LQKIETILCFKIADPWINIKDIAKDVVKDRLKNWKRIHAHSSTGVCIAWYSEHTLIVAEIFAKF